jgi:hypothetical protein
MPQSELEDANTGVNNPDTVLEPANPAVSGVQETPDLDTYSIEDSAIPLANFLKLWARSTSPHCFPYLLVGIQGHFKRLYPV